MLPLTSAAEDGSIVAVLWLGSAGFFSGLWSSLLSLVVRLLEGGLTVVSDRWAGFFCCVACDTEQRLRRVRVSRMLPGVKDPREECFLSLHLVHQSRTWPRDNCCCWWWFSEASASCWIQASVDGDRQRVCGSLLLSGYLRVFNPHTNIDRGFAGGRGLTLVKHIGRINSGAATPSNNADYLLTAIVSILGVCIKLR